MKRRLAAALLAAAAAPALAADIDSIQLLSQREFRLLSEDLGAALSFKPLIPSEALGITGFDLGVAVTGTKLKNVAILEKASSGGDVPSVLPVPTLRLHKGLPLNLDVGLAFSRRCPAPTSATRAQNCAGRSCRAAHSRRRWRSAVR